MAAVNLPLSERSVAEKVASIEALWESLSAEPEQIESPEWQVDVLRARAGETDFIDGEQAKSDFRRELG